MRCDNPYFMKLYNKSYFEAARRLRNRSLLDVNEDFSGKADAERALLDSFYLLYYHISQCTTIRIDTIDSLYSIGYLHHIIYRVDRTVVDIGDDKASLDA